MHYSHNKYNFRSGCAYLSFSLSFSLYTAGEDFLPLKSDRKSLFEKRKNVKGPAAQPALCSPSHQGKTDPHCQE